MNACGLGVVAGRFTNSSARSALGVARAPGRLDGMGGIADYRFARPPASIRGTALVAAQLHRSRRACVILDAEEVRAARRQPDTPVLLSGDYVASRKAFGAQKTIVGRSSP